MQGLNSRAASRSGLHALRRSGTAPRLGRSGIGVGMAIALAWAGTAMAQEDDPNPYYIGLNQAITRNTNINSVPDGPGATYSSTGLVGGFDQSIGRQRIFGSGNVTLNRYRDFSQLNNTSYGVNAGWDWETIDRLSGTVYTSVSQGLASLENNLLQTTSDRNLVRTDTLGTRASWGGDAAVTVGAGFGYSKTSYSSPTLQASDSTNKTADLGIYYHPGATLTLGVALRYTRGDSDRAFLLSDGTYLSNRTNGRNIDLSVNWRPTVQTGATARLSYTRQSDSGSGNGYSGLTGALGFTYMPTGKLSFNGQFNRDASTNGSFYNTFTGTTTTQPTVGLASNNSVSNSFSVGATYSATAKISATAGAQYRRNTQSDSGNAVVDGYRDELKSFSLGVNWSIRRYWSLGCTASRVDRRLSGAFNDSYNGNVYGCSTRVTLR